MPKPTVVFAGSPDFAVLALERLQREGYRLTYVLTQPDKPFGRKQKLQAPPVKVHAERLGLRVLQPASLKAKEPLPELLAAAPDFLVTAAYGLKLPEWLLQLPKQKPLNIHASLLPKYRGAAPIQAAILNGDREAGISIMEMTAGIDEGPVYLQKKLPLAADEDGGSLFMKLSELGAEAIVEALERFGELQPVAQDEALASYTKKLSRADGALNFNLPAKKLERMIRAYRPWPSAYTKLEGQRWKVWAASEVELHHQASPGQILDLQDGILVACGVNALCLTSVQKAGASRIPAREIAHNLNLSQRFESL